MKTRMKIACLLLGALLIPACGDKNPAKPEPKEEDITRASIGIAGGKLESSEFTLTVPAGAFPDQTELSLQILTSPPAFGSFVRTRSFQISGLPLNFSRDMHLSLQFSGLLKDSSFIVMASPVALPDGDATNLTFKYFAAHDSSGHLVCTIPAVATGPARTSGLSALGGSRAQDELLNIIFGISEYDTRYYGVVSIMRCPKIMLETLTTPILMVPSVCAAKLKSLGLSFEEPENFYELNVGEFTNLSGSDPQYVVMNPGFVPGTAKQPQYLQLNYEKMIWNDRVAICRQTAREFFYRVPAFYYAGRLSGTHFLAKDQVWLHAAIGSWFEESLPPEDPDFIPTGLKGHETQIFDGLVAGGMLPARNMRQHGYAEAPLVKYLVTHYRESALNRIYDAIAADLHPAQALAGSMADPPRIWWPDFVQRYISGEFYGVQNQVFLDGVTQTFQIRSSRDTLTSWTDNYPDISARLYRIDLEYADIPAGAQLQFAVSGSAAQHENTRVTLFGINQGKLEFWTGGDTVNVAKIRDLTQAGYDILAVVTCSTLEKPYYHTQGITLEVRLIQPVAFTAGRFKARIEGVQMYSDGTSWNAGVFYLNDYWHTGGVANNRFQASWNITTTDPTREGSLTVWLDAGVSPMVMTAFEFHETTRSGVDIETLDCVSKKNLAVAGEVTYSGGSARIFRIKDTQACEALAALANNYTASWGGWNLTSFSCDEESYVEITLE